MFDSLNDSVRQIEGMGEFPLRENLSICKQHQTRFSGHSSSYPKNMEGSKICPHL